MINYSYKPENTVSPWTAVQLKNVVSQIFPSTYRDSWLEASCAKFGTMSAENKHLSHTWHPAKVQCLKAWCFPYIYMYSWNFITCMNYFKWKKKLFNFVHHFFYFLILLLLQKLFQISLNCHHIQLRHLNFLGGDIVTVALIASVSTLGLLVVLGLVIKISKKTTPRPANGGK